MSERVKFPSGAGEAEGVLFGSAAAGVVVIQEWWGVNEQIQGTAKKWADAGFTAIVPDLFHGKLARTADEASHLMKELDFPKAVQEIAGAVAYLKQRGCKTVAVTGYCMGGALTFATAVNVRGLAAVVPYYGYPGELDWSKIDCPIQAHFVTRDDWATVELAKTIQSAVKVPMELFVYEADHAFCNDKRPEVYDADACQLAWERALAFVKQHASV
jgi:carboxymethylenebutenolidase